MRALVTGATGFIGSHLADLLHKKGFDVRCTIRKTSSLRWLKDKPYELIEASLSDRESLKKAVKDVDYVFHVAGLTYAHNYEEFLKGNRDGTKNLLDAVLEASPKVKRFLFVSSETVAGPSRSFEEPMTEDMPAHPITSYGKSKKAAEDEVLNVKDKIPVTVIRAPAVFGPRDTEIYQIFKTVKSGLGTLVGLKPKYLSLVYSADLVKGIFESAMSDKAAGEIYFIANDGFYNWHRLITIIQEALGKKFVIKLKLPHFIVLSVAGISGFIGKFKSKPPVFNYEKGIDFIQDFWTCSNEKAKRDFGFQPDYSIEDALVETIKWYKENNWL